LVALIVTDDSVLRHAGPKPFKKLFKALAFAKEYLHLVDSPTFQEKTRYDVTFH